MILEHIETVPFAEDIEAKLRGDYGSVRPGLFTIVPNPQMHTYLIRTRSGALEFEFKNPQDKIETDDILRRGAAHICSVKTTTGRDFVFDLYSFAGNAEDFGEIEILAEKDKLEKLPSKMKTSQKDGDFYKELAENCTIELDGETCFIMQGDYEKSDPEEAEDENENESGGSCLKGAFSILCERSHKCCAIKIQQKNLTTTGNGKYFTVTGIRQRRNIKPEGNFHLIKAKLSFSDQKKAATDYNLEKLRILTERDGSYLKAWREYTGARGNRVLKCARDFGALHYTNVELSENGTVKLFFKSDNIAEKINESSVESVLVYENKVPLPEFLTDTKCDFLTYCEKKALNKNDDDPGIECAVYGAGPRYIEVRPYDELPEKGYIVMSMKGEESQIARQNMAWNAIREGGAGIDSLGNILEGSFDFMTSSGTSPKVTVSNRVREKIFTNPPTDRQLEAIDMTLRTPEIALVQGPPGTGKTTVITAILEILNENQEKRGVSAGKVLVSSYQHDAVENMIERIRVNSLPTWKYGKRRNDTKEYNEHIEEWCREIEKRVLELHPNIRITLEEEMLNAFITDYIYSPLPENKQKLLEYIKTLPIANELAKEAGNLMDKAGNQIKISSDEGRIMRRIRALRTSAETFADDGSQRAMDLYSSLKSINYFDGHPDVESLLETLAVSKNPEESDLKKLAGLKHKLLGEFSPLPLYIEAEVDKDVTALCTRVIESMEQIHGKQDKKEQIIADWVKNLLSGPAAFAKAIKECDFVYAATSQQSVGKDILKQKKAVSGQNASYSKYDTVIIDEAARATPPDLLIPMCLAVKRIILVGDHRQLPQLIDDDLCSDIYKNIEQEIEKSSDDGRASANLEDVKKEYESAYHLSLFERLFKELKKLEEKDGIKRTITLDKQYRTHPVLGKFCSRLFYEPYGEGYESPRPASEFSHNLPGIENKAAVWINVPDGKEESCGTSRINKSEADCIAEYFMKFVRSQKNVPREKKLSCGIITFYSAQRNLIERKLESFGNELKDVKYKVGTVDAFQGMEFDVVFLSIVRTRGKIDFLTPNRMCVSMSRQKKVLIAVGGAEFATSKAARSMEIPALAEFYDLCSGKNDEGYGEVLTWKK